MTYIECMHSIDLSKLDVHGLRLLVAVYEDGSISRAADRVDLGQSTVSHGIDKMRRILGDPLFVKVGREIAPTAFTDSLIPKVREILSLIEGLTASGTISPGFSEQPVSLAVNVTELLPELENIRDAVEAHAPGALLRILELGSRENLEPLLTRGDAEIAISVRLPTYPPTLARIPLFSDETVVYYDASMRAAPNTIEAYCAAPHATLDFGGARRSTVAVALERMSLARKVTFSVANAYALGRLMRGTPLVATMQARLANSVFAGLSHCRPPILFPSIHFDLVWHRRNQHAPRNIWLRETILNALGAPAFTSHDEHGTVMSHRVDS